MRVQRSLYEVLDVPPSATAEQIRHAYRVAARRTHPDAGGSSPAFDRVTLAYRVLGDPDRRRRYDLRLAAGTPHPSAPRRSSPGPSAPGRSSPGPSAPGPGAPGPGADPMVRRRYLALMLVALTLFISAGTVVRLYSVTAAMIMMVVAAMIPPVAVTVASRPRRAPSDPRPRAGEDRGVRADRTPPPGSDR
ncbi:hypothetical protein ThrDRAFT_01352 [Frankia casuarinae]|nr:MULTISPECIES: J domain-containing protein [Frankia]EYT92969.1 hypothetical protein ThrDRAFT_01352 [Frankia casuarinae]KEZ36710.1 DnaJ-like protein [Frankia sp. CeD]